MASLTMEAMLEDDDALMSALDALDARDAPTLRAHGSGTECLPADEPTGEELGALIGAANAALRDTDHTVPSLFPDARNAGTVLRAALIAIPRLVDAAQANLTLRRIAETDSTRAATALKVSERARIDEKRQHRVQSRADTEAIARAQAAITRERSARTRAVADAADARASAARSTQRGSAAASLARRHERDLSRLQARVHTLLGSTRRPRLAAEATPGTAFASSPRARTPGKSATGDYDNMDGVRTFAMLAADAVRARADAADAENEQLRKAVRAVHVELDALLETFPHVLQVEREQQLLLNGEDEFEAPPQAPSDARMLLPYALLEEEVDSALVTKFKILRRALCLDALDVADYQKSAGGVDVGSSAGVSSSAGAGSSAGVGSSTDGARDGSGTTTGTDGEVTSAASRETASAISRETASAASLASAASGETENAASADTDSAAAYSEEDKEDGDDDNSVAESGSAGEAEDEASEVGSGGEALSDDMASEQVESVQTARSIAVSSEARSSETRNSQVSDESGTGDGGMENKMGKANGVSRDSMCKETR